jgi:hypothetical protein
MKIAIALGFAISVALGMSSVAAQSQADGKKYDKGSTVTLQGCVVAAEKKDTWVLTNVREFPASTSGLAQLGRRYYWLEDVVKELRVHGGHTIQVTGKISDVKKSEIDLEVDDSTGGVMVEIEGPGTDVRTTAANVGVTQTIGALTGDAPKSIPITLLKVKVDELKMLAASCNP